MQSVGVKCENTLHSKFGSQPLCDNRNIAQKVNIMHA